MSRKADRRSAVAAEQARRWDAAAKESPLSREQHQALLEHVAAKIASFGHTNSYSFTEEWLLSQSLPVEPTLAFLQRHRAADDYALLLHADPCLLFGPTDSRLRWMPIDRPDLEQLIDYVDGQCGEHGCDHSTRFTEAFLVARQLPVGTTTMALLASCGGGCDCEVVLNVELESIYPRTAA